MELTFEEARDLFIRDRKYENVSKHTITYYQRALTKFEKTLEKQSLSTTPSHITPEIIKYDLALYLLESEGLQPVSINNILRAIRAFFNYLHDSGLIINNPVYKLRLMKQTKKIMETFTDEELFALMSQARLNTFAGVRDYTMLLLFLETGIRRRELCDLTLDDIDWKRGSIRIIGKGSKERFVYFQDKMRRQLENYVSMRGESAPTRALFIIKRTQRPIDTRLINEQISAMGVRAGLKVKCTPHKLRHTFARMSVENKAKLFTLQSLMGHSTLNQILTYVNLFGSEIKKDHKKFSPLENLFN